MWADVDGAAAGRMHVEMCRYSLEFSHLCADLRLSGEALDSDQHLQQLQAD